MVRSVFTKRAIDINGVTELILMKVDVLDSLEYICVGEHIDNSDPYHPLVELISLPGWQKILQKLKIIMICLMN